MSEKELSVEELAAELNVSKATVYSWVYKKWIPYTKLGGLKFNLSAVKESRTFHPAPVTEFVPEIKSVAVKKGKGKIKSLAEMKSDKYFSEIMEDRK